MSEIQIRNMIEIGLFVSAVWMLAGLVSFSFMFADRKPNKKQLAAMFFFCGPLNWVLTPIICLLYLIVGSIAFGIVYIVEELR